jgi:hypothetical protein
MDVEVKQELETELRECSDEARQGMEAAQNKKHLQQTGDSLMAELQRQAAGQRTDMQSVTGSQEQSTPCQPNSNTQNARDSGMRSPLKSKTILE